MGIGTTLISRATDAAGNIFSMFQRLTLGMYFAHSGVLAIAAAAHAATGGFIWLVNPVGSGVNVRIKRIRIKTSAVTAAAFVTSPRLTIERMTFTGANPTSPVTPAKRMTADAAAVAVIGAGAPGVPTAGAVIASVIVPAVITAVGVSTSALENTEVGDGDMTEEIVLAAGEGIVIRQADAGSVSDTRIAVADFVWEEY